MNGHTQSGIYDIAQTPSGEITRYLNKKAGSHKVMVKINKKHVIYMSWVAEPGGGGGEGCSPHFFQQVESKAQNSSF